MKKEYSRRSEIYISLSVISLIFNVIASCQFLEQEYFGNNYFTLIGAFPFIVLVVASILMNYRNKRKVLAGAVQLSNAVVLFIGLFFEGIYIVPNAFYAFWNKVFNSVDLAAYAMLIILIVAFLAVFAAFLKNSFWFSLCCALNALMFLLIFIWIIASKSLLKCDYSFSVAYLLFYVSEFLLSIDLQNDRV